MEFARPELLQALWFVPGFVLLGVLALWSRQRRMARWADQSLWISQAPHRAAGLRLLRLVLLAVALGFAILAAARPQAAARLVQVESQGIEVVVLLDTSLSMEATDVVPSRLDSSRQEIRELFRGLEGARVGLVLFSGSSLPLCPLTSDVAGANLFLDAVSVDVLPDPGTNLEEALRGAYELLDRETPGTASRAVILFSDGESHDGDPFTVAAQFEAEGIPILTVGVGTRNGMPIPVLDARGQ